MTAISRQALVADVGGTNVRFAISDIDELTISHFAVFRCDMFSSLQEAIRAYLDSVPHRPALACLAVAGPVSGDSVAMTNLPWTFTRDELRSATGAEHVHLVNDFEALALSLPCLVDHDLAKLSGAAAVDLAPKAVLGPGTGLGVAGLVHSPSGWCAIGGEGGHASFAVQTAEELAIVERIGGDDDHVSAEKLLSGPGLANLYRALGEIGGVKAEALAPARIVERALAREDRLAEETLDCFVKWLGRFAGDVALFYGARGGVYLGGGVALRIVDALAGDAFAQAFRSKGRLSSFLAPIPVNVIKAPDAGLRGAAVALSDRLAAGR